jgi:16S rRNA (cytosine1402-N4)-methyltransferase
MGSSSHQAVLLAEVLTYLRCEPDGLYVDGTVGGGGHARAILEKSSPTGRLIGLDWDEAAIRRARENLFPFGARVDLQRENYKNLPAVLKTLSLKAVDGILLDLGMSTEQLEDRERGFSFRFDGPLDMRMDRERSRTAQDLLERLSVAELTEMFRTLGEERWAGRIAKRIAWRRQKNPIRSTRELVEVIQGAVPSYRGSIHVATRTFQALRVAVNEELDNLAAFLEEAGDLLNLQGRLGIISFHSLEDRLVKHQFRQWSKGEGRNAPLFRILTPKPVIPSKEEIAANPRARSAKLRVVERVGGN